MPASGQTALRPSQPLVIFDGDCGFCRFWVERSRAWTGDRVAYEPYQSCAQTVPELPAERFQEAVQLVESNGAIYSGADAVFHTLQVVPRFQKVATWAEHDPEFMRLARPIYRFVASHRTVFSILTKVGWGRDPRPSTFAIPGRIFAHAFGVIFLCAFLSLVVQVKGLVGARGIVPAKEFLDAVHTQLLGDAFVTVPTIFWIRCDDAFITAACLTGIAFSILLASGRMPGLASLVCWILYLSLSNVSSPFLDFQWDTLLLETAVLASVYLSWRFRPDWNRASMSNTIGRWLICWLLFRLMFESGAVKLSSGDPTWRNLTALQYHYQTQPLPIWTAWYAGQAPVWILKLETLGIFAVELLAPFSIFAPRRLRHTGAMLMIALQVGILLTGNYAFFNWLTIALCIPLFDDTAWPRAWQRRFVDAEAPRQPTSKSRFWWILIPATAVVILLTGTQVLGSIGLQIDWPQAIQRVVTPFRSVNAYGLFRVMTTERPEISIEGSNDGRIWQEYHFRWKPGDVHERPHLVAPHQPRLDWQMCFAALGTYNQNEWFIRLLDRLLEGEPEVVGLLDGNPFPDAPPKFIRALKYDYRFSKEHSGSVWWVRELKGLYCPPLTKIDEAGSPRGRLRFAEILRDSSSP